MLNRDASVPVALILFDVLELDGEPTLGLPYLERRELLESLTFGSGCHLSPRFEDGAALWRSVLEHRREGVLATRPNEPYRPGERAWVKEKSKACPSYEAERAASIRDRSNRR